MNTLVKQAGLPEPIYEEIGSNFVVTFKKEKAKEQGTLNEGLNEGLKTAYSAVAENPGIQAKDLSTVLKGRPIKTIERQIKKLIELELIERKGSRKTGGYWIIGNDKNKD